MSSIVKIIVYFNITIFKQKYTTTFTLDSTLNISLGRVWFLALFNYCNHFVSLQAFTTFLPIQKEKAPAIKDILNQKHIFG